MALWINNPKMSRGNLRWENMKDGTVIRSLKSELPQLDSNSHLKNTRPQSAHGVFWPTFLGDPKKVSLGKKRMMSIQALKSRYHRAGSCSTWTIDQMINFRRGFSSKCGSKRRQSISRKGICVTLFSHLFYKDGRSSSAIRGCLLWSDIKKRDSHLLNGAQYCPCREPSTERGWGGFLEQWCHQLETKRKRQAGMLKTPKIQKGCKKCFKKKKMWTQAQNWLQYFFSSIYLT